MFSRFRERTRKSLLLAGTMPCGGHRYTLIDTERWRPIECLPKEGRVDLKRTAKPVSGGASAGKPGKRPEKNDGYRKIRYLPAQAAAETAD